jgi:hypothetical protein
MSIVLQRPPQSFFGRHVAPLLHISRDLGRALKGRAARRRPGLVEIVIQGQEKFRLGQALDFPRL